MCIRDSRSLEQGASDTQLTRLLLLFAARRLCTFLTLRYLPLTEMKIQSPLVGVDLDRGIEHLTVVLRGHPLHVDVYKRQSEYVPRPAATVMACVALIPTSQSASLRALAA